MATGPDSQDNKPFDYDIATCPLCGGYGIQYKDHGDGKTDAFTCLECHGAGGVSTWRVHG